jgi:FkbM family methyltransferase
MKHGFMEVPLSNLHWSAPEDSYDIYENGIIKLRIPENKDNYIEFDEPLASEDWITIKLYLIATRECESNLYLRLISGRESVICSVDRDGTIVNKLLAEGADVEKLESGEFVLAVTFYNIMPKIGIGLIASSGSLMSPGATQYQISKIELRLDRPEQVGITDILHYIDVGARWGRTFELKQLRRQISVTMFEPDLDAVPQLLREAEKYPGTTVVPRALSNANANKTLYITKGAPCSSLLMPNLEFLKSYDIGNAFEVVRSVQVPCSRYDTLFYAGEVPKPDAVKLDVQGTELDVLEGFGDLLSDCIGVELEAHVYPIYYEQKLLTDITKFLAKFELMLVRLVPQKNFGDDLIEFNAWFLKRDDWYKSQGGGTRQKLQALKKAWFLP